MSKIHSNQSISWLLKEEKEGIEQKAGIENLKTSKTFIDYSETIDDVYENLEGYNPTTRRKVLQEFHVMIADMESNKKVSLYWLKCF